MSSKSSERPRYAQRCVENDGSVEATALLHSSSHPSDDKLVYRAEGVLHRTVEVYVWAVVLRSCAASILAALFAGVAFGYNAIKPVLLDAGVLHSLCPEGTLPSEQCSRQIVALNSLLDLAALSANFMLLPTSLVIQRIGLRWSILASGVITAGSVALFGWASDGVHGLRGVDDEARLTIMRVAYILIALGGSMFFATVNSYPLLLKRAEPHPRAALQALFSTIITACWDLSAISPYIINVAYFNGGRNVLAVFGVFGAVALVLHAAFAVCADVPVKLPPAFYALHGGPAYPEHTPKPSGSVEIKEEEDDGRPLLAEPTTAEASPVRSPSYGTSAGASVTNAAPQEAQIKFMSVRRRAEMWWGSADMRALRGAKAWAVYLATSFSLLSMYFFMTTVNDQARLLGNGQVSADTLIETFSLMLPLVGFGCAVVIAPVLEGHVGEHTVWRGWVFLAATGALWAGLSAIESPISALITYVVFVIWRVACFVVLYHHAREQFSEANFIWVAYAACGLGGFFVVADFPLNGVVANSGAFGDYVAGNVALQVPCVASALWAAYLTWPSREHRAYFADKRIRLPLRSPDQHVVPRRVLSSNALSTLADNDGAGALDRSNELSALQSSQKLTI